jgi:RimJ/RimL family protein N-acetyltransferase
MELVLRDTVDDDFAELFALHRDAASSHMAAFRTADADAGALAMRWKAGVASGDVTQKVIVADGVVAGYVASFLRDGKPQVAYWIRRSQWGRGLATFALAGLLREVTTRPLYASAVADNVASLRVLAKNGFVATHTEKAFATARGVEVDEVSLELR